MNTVVHVTKTSRAKAALSSGDFKTALKIVASFPGRCLGEHRDAITRGWAALQHPRFYAEIGLDPASLVESGVRAIKDRYGW